MFVFRFRERFLACGLSFSGWCFRGWPPGVAGPPVEELDRGAMCHAQRAAALRFGFSVDGGLGLVFVLAKMAPGGLF